VVEGDDLKTGLSGRGPAVVAGNLPYYITSPILDLALGLGSLLKRAVFLVQREVAERLAAAPGSRNFGYLSVAAQARCRVEKLFEVKPGAFKPPPKVDSAVVRFTPRDKPAAADMDGFLRFASECFRQKRKTLRNNLAGRYPRELVETWPDAGLRAEQIGVERLAELWRLTGAGAVR
jgi:16S rRNA (adenine1518-N6/adenine1519-N6)-dimethyltransferase